MMEAYLRTLSLALRWGEGYFEDLRAQKSI